MSLFPLIEKAELTYHFLQRKKKEYDSLGMEIEELKREVETEGCE